MKKQMRHRLVVYAVIVICALGLRLMSGAVADLTPLPSIRSSHTGESALGAQPTDGGEPSAPSAFGEAHIAVDYLSQEGYPTGCESASAVMLLRFWGVSMDMDAFIDEYLDCGEIRWGATGMIAPHPAEQFVGDPRSTAAYGCYAPVIIRALERCLPSGLLAVDATDSTLPELCARYIDSGCPVMVWATMDMKPAREGNVWTLDATGTSFTWLAGEHCLLLTGYDADSYYFNDPYQNHGEIAYARALVEARFEQLGQQAVAVVKD